MDSALLRPGKVTFWLTLFAIGVSLYHLGGLDYDHTLLFLTSPPAWIIPLFTSIQLFNKYLLYFLTIVSWFAIGLFLDYWIHKKRASHKSE